LNDSQKKKLKVSAARYAARSERAPSEVFRKLVSWGADQHLAESIISELKTENFLDEARYCRAFVLDKFKFNKWGKLKIANYLRQKQLPESEIENGLAEIEPEAYQEMIKGLIAQKSQQLKDDLTSIERKKKISQFLLQKGFEFSAFSSEL